MGIDWGFFSLQKTSKNLYYEQTKNPNFRIESDEEQKMNDEPYVDLNNECYCQE